MSETATSEVSKLPDDYPGKTATFGPEVDKLVYGIFGVQSKDSEKSKRYAAELRRLLQGVNGAPAIERMTCKDSEGYYCDITIGYWKRVADYDTWFASPAVRSWWKAFPLDASVGLWREVMTPHKDYYQYGAGVPQKGGLSALGELIPCDKFGYWGGYRDRVPASTHDKFLPAFQDMPQRVARETFGKRLSVKLPNNICYIREGQGWNLSGDAERQIWKEQMEKPVDQWVSELHENPYKTGCFSLLFGREHDMTTGEPIEKQSQLAFLLSLSHIERAARTNHSHLCVHKSFSEMYTQPKFEPRMHIWVEMVIVKEGDMQTEYVNCHPMTSMLPYFEPTLV
jgi:aldoxime dehydratase